MTWGKLDGLNQGHRLLFPRVDIVPDPGFIGLGVEFAQTRKLYLARCPQLVDN